MTLVAGHVPHRLRERRVERIHGCPGDATNGLPGAFDRAKGAPVEADQEIAPVPSHVTPAQGRKAAGAGVRGPERVGVAARGVRKPTEGPEQLPGRHS
ncbi:hypothetical protein [Streptomyces sp. NPDC046870]|uniref:hypothetical protein n=1 Tax=Streptomyces sp. NPDC046870 TaxID=3155135 RepID=UPI0034528EC9